MVADSIQDTEEFPTFGEGFWGPGAVGAVLFLIAAPVHLLVPHQNSVAIAAVTLALIGGAYIRFGATANSLKRFLAELAVAVLFAATALAGLLWTPLVLLVGLAAHAAWDLLHHNGVFGAPVPRAGPQPNRFPHRDRASRICAKQLGARHWAQPRLVNFFYIFRL